MSVADGDRGPLASPVWYDYVAGGDLWLLTQSDSRKGRLLQAAGRASLCVQHTDPPYQYVSVEGPIVSIDAYDVERDLLPMAQRYLGPEGGRAYADGMAEKAAKEPRAVNLPDHSAVYESVRGAVESAYHPSCACRMGEDDMAVVDSETRVHGIEALRVVDSSIFPTITNGNLNSPTIMLAERAADIIKGKGMLEPSDANVGLGQDWETQQRSTTT